MPFIEVSPGHFVNAAWITAFKFTPCSQEIRTTEGANGPEMVSRDVPARLNLTYHSDVRAASVLLQGVEAERAYNVLTGNP
jgi:hypothetical protein